MTSSDFASRFSPELAERIGCQLASRVDDFDVARFVAHATDGLDARAMKDRVIAFADAIAGASTSFTTIVGAMVDELGPVVDPDSGGAWADFELWPYTMYVRRHGLEHVDVALDALGELTRRFTAEFAIRPYLVRHPDVTFAWLDKMVGSACPHQRRLVSEGTRPRLPWGERLRALQADPSPSVALLDALIDDPSEYVRRSVANHLNDISKDHPAMAVSIAERWRDDRQPHRVRLVRHGLRTLVKAGDAMALAATGVRADAPVDVASFQASESVLLGGALELDATIQHAATEPLDLVVDFVVHHVRANGTTSPKVFKWRRATVAPGETLALSKRHAIRPITTRRYYPGTHTVELQVNGVVRASRNFELTVPDQS